MGILVLVLYSGHWIVGIVMWILECGYCSVDIGARVLECRYCNLEIVVVEGVALWTLYRGTSEWSYGYRCGCLGISVRVCKCGH